MTAVPLGVVVSNRPQSMYFYNSTQILPVFPHTNKTHQSLPRPTMVPAILRRRLRLYPSVLNRHARPDARLLHGKSVQLADLVAFRHALAQLQPLFRGQAVGVDEAESLAGVEHAPVLPFELELVLFALFVLVELPGAVDGPVAKGAVAVFSS